MSDSASSSFMYVESTVPEGMTLSDWRQAKASRAPRRLPRMPRLGPVLRPRFVG